MSWGHGGGVGRAEAPEDLMQAVQSGMWAWWPARVVTKGSDLHRGASGARAESGQGQGRKWVRALV